MRPVLLFLLLLPTLAFAHDGVHVTDGWAPPSLGQPNAIGFMTLNAPEADALIGVDSDCCAVVEMHNMTMTGDVMQMRRVDAIALPAHQEVRLESGGYHLMLLGLKKPLKAGDTVPLTLNFKHAKPLAAELAVKQRPVAPMAVGH